MSFKELDDLLDEDAPSPQAAVEATRPTIVVVDDDEAVRRSLNALFRKRYQVLLCATADEGVAAVNEEVCAVILDVKMQGHDGFWACSELRKAWPEVPVIFYSAYQDLKDPYEIINEHRPFGYLTKDGDHAQLVRSVDMAVRLHQITVHNKKLVRSLKRGGARGA